MKKYVKGIKDDIMTFLLLLPAVFVCLPIILLVTGSVMGKKGQKDQYYI